MYQIETYVPSSAALQYFSEAIWLEEICLVLKRVLVLFCVWVNSIKKIIICYSP